MELRLYDTLSREKRVFAPIDEKRVRMYVCGPTVYDFAHIGNARPAIVFDVLFRLLRHLYGAEHVSYVRNITDVDDKINARAAEEYPDLPLNEAIRRVTEKTDRQYHEDVAALGCLSPTVEPRATEHIAEMRALIERLLASGNAYVAEDNVLFSVPSMPDYGRLARRSLDEMIAGARVDVAPYKRDPMDFVLWKPSKPGEPSWPSPGGIAAPGRPGWHIECSVMSMEELGETFDLHAGGEDLIFPHHENEIAQSESLTGKTFARFWFHARFLLVEGEKMSKSLGNFFTLRDLVLKGHKPSSIRYLLTSVPYRNQLNFTFDGLRQAATSVDRLRNFRLRISAGNFPPGSSEAMRKLARDTGERMQAALDDDLNTAQAQAAIFEMVRAANAALDTGEIRKEDVPPLLGALAKFEEIFAVLADDDIPKMKSILDWARAEGRESEASQALLEIVGSGQLFDADIEAKIAQMKQARDARDFRRSDALRTELTDAGILVEITRHGIRWRRK